MARKLLKIPGGKLLSVDAIISSGRIKSICISGDFFIYPEESLIDLESFLVGKKKEEIANFVLDYFSGEEVNILGFGPEHLINLLESSFDDEI